MAYDSRVDALPLCVLGPGGEFRSVLDSKAVGGPPKTGLPGGASGIRHPDERGGGAAGERAVLDVLIEETFASGVATLGRLARVIGGWASRWLRREATAYGTPAWAGVAAAGVTTAGVARGRAVDGPVTGMRFGPWGDCGGRAEARHGVFAPRNRRLSAIAGASEYRARLERRAAQGQEGGRGSLASIAEDGADQNAARRGSLYGTTEEDVPAQVWLGRFDGLVARAVGAQSSSWGSHVPEFRRPGADAWPLVVIGPAGLEQEGRYCQWFEVPCSGEETHVTQVRRPVSTSDPQATADTQTHPGLPAQAWLFPDDAGVGRLSRHHKGHRVRARQRTRKERSFAPIQAQGTLFGAYVAG